MSRRHFLCGLALASAVLACFAGWLVRGQRVSLARLGQVKIGMSREEVIRTIGVPPGDYSNGQRKGAGGSPCLEDRAYQSWLYNNAELVVYFDDAGKVDHCFVLPKPTLTERIRRWLGL
jgi:outer membrane protein assembly factor BamE (lipoprotein component of BamABCDE complex)